MRRIVAILLIFAVAGLAGMSAQRRVNPVNNASTATQSINENKERGDSIDRSRLIEMTDSRGNVVLVDTISGREFQDTLSSRFDSVPKMIYPLFHSASISADIFDLAMRAFGQHYGLIGFSAELNLHNRYIPVVEIGFGQAKNTPEDNNYTYSTPLATYFKLGVNYNFLYNSNPDYMVYAGLRYGFSPFKWEITDITQPPGYWDEPVEYSIGSQSATAGYYEILFGLRIKIAGNFSLGWSVKYHSILHESNSQNGRPWYIPGYGARGGSIGASFALTYTLPLNRSTLKKSTAETLSGHKPDNVPGNEPGNEPENVPVNKPGNMPEPENLPENPITADL